MVMSESVRRRHPRLVDAAVAVQIQISEAPTVCPYGSRKPQSNAGRTPISSDIRRGIEPGPYAGALAGGNRLSISSPMDLWARLSRQVGCD